jgi:hypothetical protein
MPLVVLTVNDGPVLTNPQDDPLRVTRITQIDSSTRGFFVLRGRDENSRKESASRNSNEQQQQQVTLLRE